MTRVDDASLQSHVLVILRALLPITASTCALWRHSSTWLTSARTCAPTPSKCLSWRFTTKPSGIITACAFACKSAWSVLGSLRESTWHQCMNTCADQHITHTMWMPVLCQFQSMQRKTCKVADDLEDMHKPEHVHVCGAVTDESAAGTFWSPKTPTEKARNLISRRMRRVALMCLGFACGKFRACLTCRTCCALVKRIALCLQPT
jgi:hypothetical protein